MHAAKWFASAVVSLALSVMTAMIGFGILPTAEVAQKKGTYIPWILTWLLLWGTVVAGVVLAGYMVMYATGKFRDD